MSAPSPAQPQSLSPTHRLYRLVGLVAYWGGISYLLLSVFLVVGAGFSYFQQAEPDALYLLLQLVLLVGVAYSRRVAEGGTPMANLIAAAFLGLMLYLTLPKLTPYQGPPEGRWAGLMQIDKRGSEPVGPGSQNRPYIEEQTVPSR